MTIPFLSEANEETVKSTNCASLCVSEKLQVMGTTKCPTCGSDPGVPCIGKREPRQERIRLHEARWVAAGYERVGSFFRRIRPEGGAPGCNPAVG